MPHVSSNTHSMPRRVLWRAAWVLLWAGLAYGGWFAFWRHHLKRLEVVRPGVLLRAAQPTEFGFQHVVDQHRVKTVVSVRLEDPPLYAGLLDFGQPDGEIESHFVPPLGLRHLHWPLGEEVYFPWFTPAALEDFYALLDDPANLPVLVHCLGGRHRTGTFVALYQLEYARHNVEDVLREMHSFDFGDPASIQDHNLRTYLPRPQPSPAQWERLLADLFPGEVAGQAKPSSYPELVRRLKSSGPEDDLVARAARYIADDRPFALCLAERWIERPDHFLAATAADLAAQHLETSTEGQTLSSAAALVADFGAPHQQRRLLEFLESEARGGLPTARYAALVAGATNRYTPNRIPYLAPLLGDTRSRPEAAARDYRFCDTATARLISITNEPHHNAMAGRPGWNLAVNNARRWLAANPQEHNLSKLLPAPRKSPVRVGTAPEIDGPNPVR